MHQYEISFVIGPCYDEVCLEIVDRITSLIDGGYSVGMGTVKVSPYIRDDSADPRPKDPLG